MAINGVGQRQHIAHDSHSAHILQIVAVVLQTLGGDGVKKGVRLIRLHPKCNLIGIAMMGVREVALRLRTTEGNTRD